MTAAAVGRLVGIVIDGPNKEVLRPRHCCIERSRRFGSADPISLCARRYRLTRENRVTNEVELPVADSEIISPWLRGSAGRWILGAPSISVVDESGDHEHGGGEAECGVAVAVSPV
ncbi:MAG: hypothetical protein ACI8TP_004980, partial [Acidimicrobiales bacterium]